MLWRQRGAIGNPRYGIVGMGVLPYTTFIEGLGPLLEIAGYALTAVAAFVGLLSWDHYKVALLLAAAVVENFGYRQLNAWWGCVGTMQAVSGTGGWGPMKRKSF